ncbi:glycosyltransferase, partial [Candidatus Kaiserbacteria bacterium]|nr:glycosyltransferase [Candidatus Kaiserbacteria bacterium]
ILYLITKSNYGGAQKYVFDLATNLDKNQYEVVVALGGSGALKDKLIESNIRVISINSLQRDISIKKELLSFWEIYKIVKKEKPDVFHINSSKAGGIGGFIGRICFVPKIIFTAHAWVFNETRPSWQKLILKFLHWLTVILSHQTITVSDALKKQMNWPFATRKMITIHNGLSKIYFLNKNEARHELATLEPKLKHYINDIWTGSIGELHTTKRHDVMINAVANLVAEGHQIRHLIIGEGELKNELDEIIKKLNLTENIFLMNHLDKASKYLKAFDIYTQPSRSEALGYTVIEATMAGLPIIASEVGGIPEIIENNKEGILVPKENSTALYNALILLLKNKELANKYANTALNKSLEFTLEKMISKTSSLYNY